VCSSDLSPSSCPTISHTYAAASSQSGYFATLTVADQKCGLQSLNVASVNIDVTGSTTAVPPEQRPLAFRIAPMENPSHGETSFALDLMRDGMVSVQLFSPDGRRVAELVHAWMPAGRHRLNWNAVDRSGQHIPAGIYLVRATSGERVALSRVALVP